jgi:hypothetical protein
MPRSVQVSSSLLCQNLVCLSLLLHTYYMPRSSHPP